MWDPTTKTTKVPMLTWHYITPVICLVHRIWWWIN